MQSVFCVFDCGHVRALGTIFLVLGASAARAEEPQEPDGKQFVEHTFSPFAGLKAAASAGIGQARDVPKEWGGGAAGFAKRFGSAVGGHFVNGSIHFAVAKMRHEEWGYRPSGKEGFGPRLKYALLSTVITQKTTDGHKTIAAGELSGTFGSALISRLWQPASTRTIAHGLTSGGIGLAADAGTRVVREFWPEIRHPRNHSNAKLRTAPLDPSADIPSEKVSVASPSTAPTQ